MNKERFDYIITKYLRGIATPEEEEELLSSIHSSDELCATFRKKTAAWCPNAEEDAEMDRKWNRIASVITPTQRIAESVRRKMWLPIAAAIILLCVSGMTAFFLKQAGAFSTDADNEWQTIVAESDDHTCVLPDGTSVFLRKGASLSYPNVFSASTRSVTVRGEAFFEVTPNPGKPFIVDASQLFVKVLGTSFSVRTFDQAETISVILVEGSVSLNDMNQKELVRLIPNQKADYSVNSGHYTVSEVDGERLTSWRKGIISYDNASLDEIVRLIEQTYHISLQYTKPENDTQRFSGAFLKTQKPEIVLELTSKLTGTNLTTGDKN